MAIVPPHTVLRFVHDTLTVHHTVVVHDTLSQFLGAVHTPFPVKLDDAISARDWMSWVVPGVIAALSALGGILIGGEQTRKASKEAIREEHNLERRHTIERMLQRIVSNLKRMQVISQAVELHPKTEPLASNVAEQLEVVWNLYYRVAESIFSIKDNDLSEKLDAFFKKAHTTGVSINRLEERAREISPDSAQEQLHYERRTERLQVPELREEEIATIIAMGKEAGELLPKVEKLKVETLV